MTLPGSPPAPTDAVVAKLSTLDRFLPVWIGVAMLVGLLLGRGVPDLGTVLQAVQVDGISLPIAIGLLVMMYPVLAKVRYDRLDSVTGDRRLLVSSLLLNWVVGPALMFALAWIFLPDHRRSGPLHRHGHHLERPRLRRPGGRRRAGGDQLGVPGSRLRGPRLVLPVRAARLARPGPDGHQRVHLGHRPQRPDLPGHTPARGILVPAHRGEGQGPHLVRGTLHPPRRTVRAVRPALHDRRAVRPSG